MRIVACIVLMLSSLSAASQEATRVFDLVSSSVVTVQALDSEHQIIGQGSGVIISAGKVVTNCHVMRDAVGVQVAQSSRLWPALWIEADLPRDICVFQVAGLTAPAVERRRGKLPEIGERIFAVGNPLGFGLAVSEGLVSGIGDVDGGQRLYSSAAQSPGSSGGGLFDSDGRLVGLTAATMAVGQNVNIVLPMAWVDDLPQRATRPPAAPAEPTAETDWLAEAEKARIAKDWLSIEALARRWVADRPNSGLGHQYLGMSLLFQLKYPEAEIELRRSLETEPRNCVTRVYLASVFRATGRRAEAETMLDEAEKIMPVLWLTLDTKARWRVEDRNDTEAYDLARRVTLIAPWEASGWSLLATIHSRLGHHVEAAAASHAWLRLKPEDAAARGMLSHSLALSGEVNQAREVLTTANSDTDATLANAWVTLGVAEEKRLRLEDAESAYKKALALDPRNALAFRNLAVIQQKTGRAGEAVASMNQAISLPSNDAKDHRYLAELLMFQKETSRAIPVLEQILRLNPDDQWALLSLGSAEFMVGHHAAARNAYARAVERQPNDAGAWMGLGQAQLLLGDSKAGESSLKKADQIKPNDAAILLAICAAYGRQGKHELALLTCDRSLALQPSSGPAWSGKGYAFLRLGRLADAVKALETAIRLQPDVANPWINLGEARLRQQQFGAAIDALGRAVALSPNATDARLYLGQAYLAARQPDLARPHFEVALHTMPNPSPALVGLVLAHLYAGRSSEAIGYWNSLKLRDSLAAKAFRLRIVADRVPGAMMLVE